MSAAGAPDIASLVDEVLAQARDAPDPWLDRLGRATCTWLAAVPQCTDDRWSLLDDASAEAGRAAEAGTYLRTWADRPLHDRRDPRLWAALHRAHTALAVRVPPGPEELAEFRLLAAGGSGIDADRLAACCVELGDRGGPVDDIDIALDRRAQPERYDPDLRPSDAVHDEVSPLFVAVARARYRAGRPRDAEQLLDDWRQRALDARAEDSTIRAADEALAWLATRMRWSNYRPTQLDGLLSTGSPRAAALVAALRWLADGVRPERSFPDLLAELRFDPDIELEVRLTTAKAVPPDTAEHALARIELLSTSDPLTACQVATALALALGRSDLPDPTLTGQVYSLVHSTYRALPPSSGLPPWGGTPTTSDLLPHDPWYGWRLRWSRFDGSAGLRPPDPSPELVATSDISVPLPGPGPQPPPSGPVAPLRVRGPAARIVLSITAVGAVAAVLLALSAAPIGQLVAVVVAIGCGLVAALIALRANLPGFVLRQTILQVSTFGGHATASIEPTTLLARLYLRLLPREVRLLARISDPRGRGEAAGCQGLGSQPVLLADAPPLNRLTGALAVVLDHGAAHQLTAWEHMVEVSGRSPLWRCIWVRDISPGRPWPWPAQAGVAVQAPTAWSRLLTRSYARTAEPVAPNAEVRISHRVGVPVMTSRGPVLQVTEDEDLGSGKDQVYVTATGTARQRAWLTVLQHTPDDGEWHRDPLSADLARHLALEVQREAGGWVLAVPAVPEQVARTVWAALATFASSPREPRRADVVALVATVKEAVVTSGAGTAQADAAREVAQDVLLIGPWATSR